MTGGKLFGERIHARSSPPSLRGDPRKSRIHNASQVRPPINLSLLLRFHVVSWIGVRCHPEQARRRGTEPLSVSFCSIGPPLRSPTRAYTHVFLFGMRFLGFSANV